MTFKQNISTRSLLGAAGFSLIELMVAMIIGLVVLNGVIQIVLNSKRSYLDNQAMSQIQENARYALDVLARDIRLAGYFGCANPEDRGIKYEAGMSTFLVDATDEDIKPFSGYEDTADFPDQFKNEVYTDANGNQPSDAIVVRFSDVYSENILASRVSASGEATVEASDGLKPESAAILVAQDCSEGLVFNVGGFVEGDTTIGGFPAGGGNDINYKPFNEGARISRMMAHGYYIGESRVVPGTPALMREVLQPDGTTKSEELALGIESISFEYGTLTGGEVVYTSADGIVDETDISVVRIGVSLRSLDFVHADNLPATNLGQNYNDRYLRQEVFTTVRIRNSSS